jgi:hypothetical protein
MFSEAINLVGAAGSGAVLGLLGNLISSGVEKKELDIEAQRYASESLIKATGNYREPIIDNGGEDVEKSYLWGLYSFKGKTRPKPMPPVFYGLLYLFGAAYCASATYCIVVGDIPVATINPTSEPVTQSILWGLWERSYQPTIVAVQTFASVGQYMFHFIAFILSAVITGAAPKRGH